MSLEMPNTLVIVHRIGTTASLVNICRKNVSKKVYLSKIENSVALLNKVFTFLNIYQQVS